MKKNIDKILVHFDTNEVRIYKWSQQQLTLLKKQTLYFNETIMHDELYHKIERFINTDLANITKVNNKTVRLYATGRFQEFSKEEQMQLTIHVYVHFGLVFNIINPDLEQFYLQKSKALGKEELMEGLICQEFRKVVICGSFQQNLKDIEQLINIFEKKSIQVLSPWTIDVVPETLGTDFILLQGQEMVNERDSWRHKYDHMNKFKVADAIIICNPDGSVGKGTNFEFGFMIAFAKRIIFTHEPVGLTVKFPYEIGLNFMD